MFCLLYGPRPTLLVHIPYARQYNLWFVHLKPANWRSKTIFQGGFCKKFYLYVWLLFKSGLWWREYGICTIFKWCGRQIRGPLRKPITVLGAILINLFFFLNNFTNTCTMFWTHQQRKAKHTSLHNEHWLLNNHSKQYIVQCVHLGQYTY